MENRKKNSSINSVIYLLLAAMLVGIVFVSVFTVASRRNGKTQTPPPETTRETLTETGKSTLRDTGKADIKDSGIADKSDESLKASEPAETSAEKKAPEDTAASAKTYDVPAAAELRYFVIPVAGTVSKSFEIDVPVYSMTMNDYRAHTGVDISAPLGSEVISASSGTVCKVWDDPLMGSCVTLDHGDGIYTTYMNLAEELAPEIGVGTKVAMGQTLGAVGESAIIEISEEPHLHLEMKVNGQYVDPLEYMGVASAQEMVYEDQ